MSINLTDELLAKTKKGKIASAKQVFLEGDKENLQQIGDKTHQLEDAFKDITVSGGASTANAVSYNNETSGMTSINAQGAIDELAAKNATKAEKAEVTAELEKKFDKESILQESGNSEDKVMSQKAVSDKLSDLLPKEAVVHELGESKDKVVSQFALPFREIESPEFIKIIQDAEGHILFTINLDGEVDWSKGIPAPIRTKLQEIINQCQKDKTDILEAINAAKEELSASITALQEGKVDKEEGKSLIEDEVKECFRIIENEEFLKAIVDSDDKVLFGFYRATGKPYYPQNDMYHISQSEEFLWVILDAANHPLLGIQQDGTCWAANAQWLDDIKAIKEALSSIDETLKTFQPKEDGKVLINLDVADSFFYISNDEYIIAVVDTEDRILAGIKYDGEPYFPNHEMYSVITNEEWLYAIIDAEGKILGGFRADDGHMVVGGIDISTFISNAIIDISDIKERTAHLSTIENDEYLSVETDAEGKVIGYTALDGSHYLYKVKSETIPTEFEHIEDPEGRTEITTDAEDKILGYRDSEGTRHEHKISAKHLELSSEAANEVNDAFKSAGIKMEYPSDFSKDNHIELPIPRIAAQVRIYAPKLPTTKQDDIEAEIEYNDKDGNYFRKPVILNAQGSSSMSYYVKNMSIDINDGSEIKFGDFPTQDSFHLKKYYIDAFRGQCIVAYWLMEQVYKSRPVGQQYPYEYSYTNDSVTDGFGDVNKDFFTGAKCHPDGFPIIITWVNSDTDEETYMGIYTWNLKKSKEVFFANKKKSSNIILDGVLGDDTIFNGTIQWNQFEIRNPKGLIDINGNKYDGDNPKELSDTDTFSKEVKNAIQKLSNVNKELKDTPTKETFEKFFYVEPFIDYMLVSQVIYHYDGFRKNWLFETLDGNRWWVNIYDTDSIFGQYWDGSCTIPNSDRDGIFDAFKINSLYANELQSRYKYLRDTGVFSVENIISLLEKWVNTVGTDNYKKEFKLYNETPSYRDSYINSCWELYDIDKGDVEPYNESKEYNVGDKCILLNRYNFICKVKNQGVYPFDKVFDKAPKYAGFHNSVIRVNNWLSNRIAFLDNHFNYK